MLQSHSMLCLGEIGISRSLGVALCIVAKHQTVQQGSKCWSWVVERELPWQSQENICNRNYVMVCGPGEDGQRGERIPKGGKKGKGKAGHRCNLISDDLRCKMQRFLLRFIAPFPIRDGFWWRRRAKMVASLKVKSPSRVTWFLGTSVVNMSMCEVDYFHIPFEDWNIQIHLRVRTISKLELSSSDKHRRKGRLVVTIAIASPLSHTILSHTPEILCR